MSCKKSTEIYFRTVSDSGIFTRNFRVFFYMVKFN